MLTYTNRLKKLVLPEYGRNIQNMVDYCLTIPDRAERSECAAAIVDAMRTLFPGTGDATEYERKLWDHVMIMSGFALDVDMPFECVAPDTFDKGPDPIYMDRPTKLQFRHYGRLIPSLIETACSLEEGAERQALVSQIANQMKKTMLAENPDGVDDYRILKDLRLMSHGAIEADPERVRLQDFKQAPTPSGRKKKKKQ